jgi:hypothetical protein
MLNFFSERCRRLGSVTEFCDNSKCSAFKSNHNNKLAKHSDKSNWEKNFQKWKVDKKGNVLKTRKAFEEETKNVKPAYEASNTTAFNTADPGDQLIIHQDLVKPIGTPREALYTV